MDFVSGQGQISAPPEDQMLTPDQCIIFCQRFAQVYMPTNRQRALLGIIQMSKEQLLQTKVGFLPDSHQSSQAG
jgi:hypothetical protein